MDSNVDVVALLAVREALKRKMPKKMHNYIDAEMLEVIAEVYQATGGSRRPFAFVVDTLPYGKIIGINALHLRAISC